MGRVLYYDRSSYWASRPAREEVETMDEVGS